MVKEDLKAKVIVSSLSEEPVTLMKLSPCEIESSNKPGKPNIEPPEIEWCQKVLDEWREDREKSKTSQKQDDPTNDVTESDRQKTITVPQKMHFGDGDNRVLHHWVRKKIKNKEVFIKNVNHNKKKRKHLQGMTTPDDTLREEPTKMPTMNFSICEKGMLKEAVSLYIR